MIHSCWESTPYFANAIMQLTEHVESEVDREGFGVVEDSLEDFEEGELE